MTKVRNATLGDIDFLMEKAIAFNNEHYDVPLDIDKLISHAEMMIESPLGVVLVSDTGIIAGILSSDLIRDWTFLVETAWYSEGRDGLRLLRAFEDRGRLLGVDEIRMTTLEVNPDAAKLLVRRGYTAIETSHRLLL